MKTNKRHRRNEDDVLKEKFILKNKKKVRLHLKERRNRK